MLETSTSLMNCNFYYIFNISRGENQKMSYINQMKALDELFLLQKGTCEFQTKPELLVKTPDTELFEVKRP